MATPEELLELRSYVHRVSAQADATTIAAESEPLRTTLRARADHALAEADAPLRIGVMGDFSAGKSLLLGVLTGKPDLLPTSAEPTTGNITELRLLQDGESADAGRTEIAAVSVRYLSSSQLDGLQRALIDGLRDITRAGKRSAGADLEQAAADGADAVTAWRTASSTEVRAVP